MAGGTGGHLFPAIRLLEEIKLRGSRYEILFITSCRKQDRDILKEKNVTFKTIPVIGFQSREILHILNFTIWLAAGMIKSLFLVLRYRPSVVIGFGGYVSGPILLLAALFRIKTIVHEQNVYPGKTNRILAGFVDRIAISFPEAVEYLKKFESKIIISGNPLRRGLKKTQRSGDTFVVLAMGGSQGAHALNRFVPEAIGLMEEERKKTLEIIHISGYKEKEEVIKAYQRKGVKSRVFSFIEEMDRLYNECDFVIARSGATTVSELLYLAKPSILIPYPHRDAHQRLNARVLEKRGSAILLEEEHLTPEQLRDVIIRFMDRDVLNDMSKKVKNTNNKDACDILIDIITGY